MPAAPISFVSVDGRLAYLSDFEPVVNCGEDVRDAGEPVVYRCMNCSTEAASSSMFTAVSTKGASKSVMEYAVLFSRRRRPSDQKAHSTPTEKNTTTYVNQSTQCQSLPSKV